MPKERTDSTISRWLDTKRPWPIRRVTLDDVKRTYSWMQKQYRPPLTQEIVLKLYQEVIQEKKEKA